MNKPILFLMITLPALLSSCNMGYNMFIASGYSGDGGADVMLCSLDSDGSIEKLSEITIGDNPKVLPILRTTFLFS